MKTKTIFKALAVAMLLPAMLLTTACSNSDDAINENPSKKGYELPVTVNVTRQGDKGTTRAIYTDNGNGTGTLGFSTGDQLYVEGSESSAGLFSGTLTWQSGGTFSGTITTDNVYSSTADELFTAAASNGYVQATLLPNGYGTYNFFGFSKGSLVWEYNNAFATSKATAIEQFSYEFANTYSSGFALAPQSAILNFTITGLAASTEVAVSLTDGALSNVSGNVTTDGDGTATFAVGVREYTVLNGLSLTVGGNAVTLFSSSMSAVAGKIYNITRPATVDLSQVSGTTYTVSGDVIFTGTPTTNSTFTITIAGECTVTLDNVNSSGEKSVRVSGSTYDKNLMLKGTSHLQMIMGTVSKSLTIDEAEAGGTVIVNGSTYTIAGSTVTVNGGTVKAKSTGSNAVRGNLVVNGGAVYLEGGNSVFAGDCPAVNDGNITGSLYGWNGSAWGSITSGSTSTARYVSTDNSTLPSAWTW